MIVQKEIVLGLMSLFFISCLNPSSTKDAGVTGTGNNGVVTFVDTVSSLQQSSSLFHSSANALSSVELKKSSAVFSSNKVSSSGGASSSLVMSSQSPFSSVVHSSSSSTPKNTFLDARDNKVYQKVVVGEQTWMAENLNFSGASSLLGPVGYCWDQSNYIAVGCSRFGRYYSWDAIMINFGNGKDICPIDWHIPSDAEWSILSSYLESLTLGLSQATMIKSKLDWNQRVGLDSFGLNFQGSGYRSLHGLWLGWLTSGSFWSSTPKDNESAWRRELSSKNNLFKRNVTNKLEAHPVRCIKDK